MPSRSKFFDGKTAAKYDLAVVISTGKLIGKTSAEKTLLQWKFCDLRVLSLPENGRGAIITNRLNTAQRLYVDAALFQNLMPFLDEKPRRMSLFDGSFKSLCLLFLIVALVIFIGFQVALKSVPYIAQDLPHKWEKSLGNFAFNLHFKDKKKCQAEKGVQSLEKLLAALRLPEAFNFEVLVLEDKTVNAFALPGERIVIYSGLLENADSAAEVAGVVAHEIGHVIEKHPTEGFVRSLGLTVIVQIMFGNLGGVGDIGSVGQVLFELSYARDAERDADRIALEILDESGIDQSKFRAFFERLEEEESDAGSEVFSYFSTHPKTSERISTISSYGETKKSYKSIMSDTEWIALKNICNE